MPVTMRARSSSRDHLAAAPHPVFFSKQQMDNYLLDLRNNVPARPAGARERPTSFVTQRRALFDCPADAATGNQVQVVDISEPSPKCTTFGESRRPSAAPSIPSTRGRPLVRGPNDPPHVDVDVDAGKKDVEPEPFIPYAERGSRWMEKQEVRSVSQALRDMDLRDEEKLFEAAQAEASELVWKHQNPNAPYRNPEEKPYDYHAHLRKGSHARSMSWGTDLSVSKRRRDASSSRSVSNGSKSSSNNSSRVPSDGSSKVPASPITPIEDTFGEELRDPAKATVQFVEPSPERKRRKITPPEQKSAKPRDDPKGATLVKAVRKVSNSAPIHFRNPFARAKQARAPIPRSESAPVSTLPRLDKFEIHKNPPTQSRNPAYTTNDDRTSLEASADGDLKMKDGKEIRSDDIRKATSMSLKDRSPKLPTPTMVSDSPGRPIVSFDKVWKPKDVQLQAMQTSLERTPSPLDLPDPVIRRSQTEPMPRAYPPSRTQPVHPIPNPRAQDFTVPATHIETEPSIPTIAVNDTPSVSVNAPGMPTIAVNNTPSISFTVPAIAVNDMPSISVNDVPSISVSDAPTISVSSADVMCNRSLPTPSNKSKHTARPSIPPTMSSGSGSVLCATCALPIAGRIVTAAGSRFHPECFTCHTCSSALECIAFYPEPLPAREERLLNPSPTNPFDADPSPRFYCHLDYHELFSPRCKSCKTPIEGTVIVACGAQWHEGHFFCAECGDPFASDTPFVEKDGYAWCVGCCAKRYSGKCKRCRRPILETVVTALGAEWHEECFCCAECKEPFTDGRYFLRPGVAEPFCPACEERRVKEMAG